MRFRRSSPKKDYPAAGRIFLKDFLKKNRRIMKTAYHNYFLIFPLTILIGWTLSCSGRSGKSNTSKTNSEKEPAEELSVKLIKMTSPEEDQECRLNGQIKIVLSPEKNIIPDSINVWFDSQLVTVLRSMPWDYTIPPSSVTETGRKSIKVVAYKAKSQPQTITRFIIVYSDTKPKKNSYKVVHSFPHDIGAFTQGLVYEDGIFFEGTGQSGSSNLRKVEPETGKVIFQINLESSLFGEGIAISGEKIFQLTWQNKVGFVYDKSTLKQIGKIYYQTEGWGLTTIGDKLVMSDGTNIICFRDTNQFGIFSKIEVYDNEKKVDKLNELEYINGEIWANIWETNLIARIDPSSGKVIAYIDLKGIISDSETDIKANFLNGIAYDQAGKRIFVTGKNWPKLFEIKITE
jgi:glutaminyl-peptide cyclotransferase